MLALRPLLRFFGRSPRPLVRTSSWGERRELDCVLQPGENYELSEGGTRYTDLVVGRGRSPMVGDLVQVHHRGRFLDGRRIPFSDSYEFGCPVTFKVGLGLVIPAWDEVVQSMREGGKRKLIATPDRAFGARGTPHIPPNSTLVYELELLRVGAIPGFREQDPEEEESPEEESQSPREVPFSRSPSV